MPQFVRQTVLDGRRHRDAVGETHHTDEMERKEHVRQTRLAAERGEFTVQVFHVLHTPAARHPAISTGLDPLQLGRFVGSQAHADAAARLIAPEPVNFRGPAVSGPVANRQKAMPVPEREVVKARGLGAIRRDQIGALSGGAKLCDGAMCETDAECPRRRRHIDHRRGRIGHRLPVLQGRRQKPSTLLHLNRLGSVHDPD